MLGDDSDHMRLNREEDTMSHHSDDGMLIAGRVPVPVPVLQVGQQMKVGTKMTYIFLKTRTIVTEVPTSVVDPDPDESA